MVPLKLSQNFKFCWFFLQDESIGTIVRSSNQTPYIVPISFKPPSKLNIWIFVEQIYIYIWQKQSVLGYLDCKTPLG